MSIKSLLWMLEAFPDEPIYCYHEIVHNDRVVSRFERHGVRFVQTLDGVPPGAPVMLSAHGTAPQVMRRAKELTSRLVDSACPLVTKVHREAAARARSGHTIIYIGDANHDEGAGAVGVAPETTIVVRRADALPPDLPRDRPVAVLAQTTLTQADVAEVENAVRAEFMEVWTPPVADRCYATTNRQDALAAIVSECDHVIVVGSHQSSNTTALVKLARELGCTSVHRVNSGDEVRNSLHGVIGITAGASAPDDTIDEVIEALLDGADAPVEFRHVMDETEHFRPPRDVSRLAEQMRTEGRPAPDLTFIGDRSVAASSLLRSL